jgi:prepilin-type N-terminal cleavage/methylation domain-containing protein
MDKRGVTLIELLVVVAVIGILVIALGFSFQGWMGKYTVESQIKTIHVDLMNARAMAMTRNRFYFADFNLPVPPANFGRYRLIDDTNDNGTSDPGAGDTVLPTYPKTLEYVINWDGGGTISFNKRGTITFPAMDPNNPCSMGGPGLISLTSTVTPDYDCICIEQTHIRMGRMNDPNPGCNEK